MTDLKLVELVKRYFGARATHVAQRKLVANLSPSTDANVTRGRAAALDDARANRGRALQEVLERIAELEREAE